MKNIREAITDRMAKVPMGVMLETPTGTFKNLIVDNVAKLEDSIAHFMPELPSNIAAPLCSILLIFILDWRMGLPRHERAKFRLAGFVHPFRKARTICAA